MMIPVMVNSKTHLIYCFILFLSHMKSCLVYASVAADQKGNNKIVIAIVRTPKYLYAILKSVTSFIPRFRAMMKLDIWYWMIVAIWMIKNLLPVLNKGFICFIFIYFMDGLNFLYFPRYKKIENKIVTISGVMHKQIHKSNREPLVTKVNE